jgi:hypothetical protein
VIILGILSALLFGMISVVITGQLSGFFFGAILGYVFEEVIALRIRINKYERVEPKPVIPSPLPEVSKKPVINIDKTPEPGWVNQPVSESTLAAPTIISITLERIIKFFTTGNIVAKVGIITLFFGIAFLIKYAAQKDYFPVELRLFACAIAAIILFIIGWKIRFNKREYALIFTRRRRGSSLFSDFFLPINTITLSPRL